MRVVAPVDVPGGDLGVRQLVLGHRQLRPVVAPTADPLDRAGSLGIELDDLTAGLRGVVRVGRCLTVHPEVPIGQLDQPIGFAGHDERIVTHPDVERLTAPPQGEEQASGIRHGVGADGHRPFEIPHRRPEGFLQSTAPRPAPGW